MSRHPSKFAIGIVIAALLQSAALAWMVYDRVSLLKNGREVIVKSVPVDPRDLFRGDYVILDYEISSLDLNKLEGDSSFSTGQKIYVSLKQGEEGFWHAVSVHATQQAPLAGEVSIRGKIFYLNDANQTVLTRYGVGKLFVPEGEGKVLEKIRNKERMQVVLAVSDNGTAAVKAIIADGKRVYEETLF